MKRQILFTDKHRPQTLGEIKGSNDQVKQAISFINTFATPRPIKKILLLSGIHGTGKTSLAKLLSESANVEPIVLNCSVERRKDSFQQMLSPYINTTNLEGGKTIIILDELDGQLKRTNNLDFLIKVVKNSENPIIATCNDSRRFPKKFIDVCMELKFKRLYVSTIRTKLIEICNKEARTIAPDVLEKLIIKGDMRASISALQIHLMSGHTDFKQIRNPTMFTAISDAIQTGTTLSKKDDVDSITDWIEENTKQLVSGIDRCDLYDLIIESSMHRKVYHMKLARLLLGNINTTIKTSTTMDKNTFIRLEKHLIHERRNLEFYTRKSLKSLCKKLYEDFHMSNLEMEQFILPILITLSKQNTEVAKHLSLLYDLEPSEIALILDTQISDPRIKYILTPSQKTTKKIKIPDPNQEQLPVDQDVGDFFS